MNKRIFHLTQFSQKTQDKNKYLKKLENPQQKYINIILSLQSVLEGYNGTIFAYGQTGSGKTYTMVGDFEDQEYKGIIPRSFDYLFERIKQIQGKEKNKYIVSIAFIQIYLELIQDLFNSKSEIKIRGDKETGVYLENATWIRVKSTNECKEAFIKGEKNRNTECTRMNAHSSRSHALLIAKIEKTYNDKQNKDHVITRGM